MTSTNLKEALDAGVAAFERTEISRQEVREVFLSLEESIRDATSGKVTLVVDADGLVQSPSEYFGRALTGGDGLSVLKSWMLQAYSSDDRREELFQARISHHGYPVMLKFLDERTVCHDREALESTLSEMLRRPEVGGKVRGLRDRLTR
jgi:hypothetical protein